MSAAGPQSNRSIDSQTKETPKQAGAPERKRTETSFFVNDKPVHIDEARPSVRMVVRAAGYDPEECRVFRLSQQDDPSGHEIDDLDERLHATPDKPIYLRCQKKDQRAPLSGVAPGIAGGAVGDMNRPLSMDDLDSPSRPRDYARDVDQDPPGGPPGPM